MLVAVCMACVTSYAGVLIALRVACLARIDAGVLVALCVACITRLVAETGPSASVLLAICVGCTIFLARILATIRITCTTIRITCICIACRPGVLLEPKLPGGPSEANVQVKLVYGLRDSRPSIVNRTFSPDTYLRCFQVRKWRLVRV